MIREACLDDVDEIVGVINKSNYVAYRGIIPNEYFKYPIVNKAEIIEDMEKMKFFVYVLDNKIVGVAALYPLINEKIGLVRYVYVLPNHQRSGIGTALLKKIEEVALNLGLKKLRLIVHEKAFWAIKFL